MEVKYLVVHCADTPDDKEFTAEDIHRWHKERGWDGIGYHSVIQRSGAIQMGRPPYWSGAHVRDYNAESLGVCLIGQDKFTDDQMRSLIDVLRVWKRKHPDAEIVGHCDLDSCKTCPNFDVKQWVIDKKVW